MRNITVVTGTRAEYGLLKNTIKAIEKDKNLNLQLVVTGTHLSHKYGYTVKEIEEDGFEINSKINIIQKDRNGNATSLEIGNLIIEISRVFESLKPDILLILGDRYEIFAAATAAMVMNIPIAHISGGEITEGAMDEQIRHAITKMAHIHFPGAEAYADNIKNMGEEAWRIFNVGDPGIENIKLTEFLDSEEIAKRIGVNVDEDTMLLTFHPVTLEIDNTRIYIENILEAIAMTNKQVIITYPNSDKGGEIIIEEILRFEKKYDKAKVFESLGSLLYLSIMKKCRVVIGNSSSGLVEAPFMKKPVINIGNRQKGRLMAENIINCDYNMESISEALKKASSSEFKEFIKNKTVSLYGEGNTSKEIVRVLSEIRLGEKLIKKKLIW